MLAAIPFKDIPAMTWYSQPNRTSKARLTAKAEGEAKISPPEGRTKASGGEGERCEGQVLFFFNGGIEGRGIDVNIRFLGSRVFGGRIFVGIDSLKCTSRSNCGYVLSDVGVGLDLLDVDLICFKHHII